MGILLESGSLINTYIDIYLQRAMQHDTYKYKYLYALAEMAREEGTNCLRERPEFLGDWKPLNTNDPSFRLKLGLIINQYKAMEGMSEHAILPNKYNLAVRDGKVSYIPFKKLQAHVFQYVDDTFRAQVRKYQEYGTCSILQGMIHRVLENGLFECLTDEYYYALNVAEYDRYRVSCKVGRILQELAEIQGIPLTEGDISTAAHYFSDLVKLDSVDLNDPDIQLYVTHKPSEIYTSDKLVADSCMARQESKRFWMYNDLDNCSMLVLEKNGYIIGRALLWERVTYYKNASDALEEQESTCIKYMDRVYGNSPVAQTILMKWGTEHGYYVRKTSDKVIAPDGIPEYHPRLEISLADNYCHDFKPCIWPEVPYMDTFGCWPVGSKVLRNWYDRDVQYRDLKVLLGQVDGFTYS